MPKIEPLAPVMARTYLFIVLLYPNYHKSGVKSRLSAGDMSCFFTTNLDKEG